MAYKIFHHVNVSEINHIVICDSHGYNVDYTSNIPRVFESLKGLPVTGFAQYRSLLYIATLSAKEMAARTIIKYWRAWKLRTTRNRNDLVLRGLAEYFGHPSRQDFSIETLVA